MDEGEREKWRRKERGERSNFVREGEGREGEVGGKKEKQYWRVR